jgi:ABC-type phosphonate transport system ATPase subunit
MKFQARVSIEVTSSDLLRNKGDIRACLEENLDSAEIDETSIDDENITWSYESQEEYTEASTPGTTLYRFQQGDV